MKSSVKIGNCGRDGGGGRAGVYGAHGGGGIFGGGTGGGEEGGGGRGGGGEGGGGLGGGGEGGGDEGGDGDGSGEWGKGGGGVCGVWHSTLAIPLKLRRKKSQTLQGAPPGCDSPRMLPLASRNPIDRTARPAVVKKTPVESAIKSARRPPSEPTLRYRSEFAVPVITNQKVRRTVN